MHVEWVTVRKFALETGYTEKAVRNKIDRAIGSEDKSGPRPRTVGFCYQLRASIDGSRA